MKSYIALIILLYVHYIRADFISQQRKEVGNSCPDGLFGSLCADECHCKGGKACDIEYGSCEDGCAGHYKPPVCNTCEDGYFGADCSGQCRCLEGNSDCNAKTGKCKSGKCSVGYDGESCQVLTGYPRIESFSVDDAVNVDQAFVVTCTAEGAPMPNMTMSSRILKAVDDGSIMDESSTRSLIVEFLAGSVTGIYEIGCQAINEHGKIEQTFNVTVVDPPELLDPPVVSDADANSISVSWGPWQFSRDKGGFASDTPEYQVVYRLLSHQTWLNNNDQWQLETSIRVTNLIADSDYEFAIRSKRKGDNGEGPVGQIAQGVTKCTFPNEKGVPQMFSFKMTSPSIAHLTWERPNHEDLRCTLSEYVLSRQDNGSSVLTVVSKPDSSQLDFQLQDLKPRSKHDLFLSAETSFGKPVGHAKLTIDTSDYIPGIVENITVATIPMEARQLLLSWVSPTGLTISDEEYVNYTIRAELMVMNACDSRDNESNLAVYVNTAYKEALVSDLHPYSIYKIDVRAQSIAGFGEPLVLTANTPEAVPSEVPTNIYVVEDGSDRLEYRWEPIPCDQANGLLAYRYSLRKVIVEESKRKRRKREDNGVVMEGETFDTTVTIGNLSAYSKYEFSVRGFTSAGDGPASFLTRKKSGNEPPLLVNPPAVGVIAANHINISWKAWDFEQDEGGAEGQQTEYMVLHRVVGHEAWFNGSRQWQSETQAQVVNLTVDTDYEFAIRSRHAGDGDGREGPAAVMTTTCDAPNEDGVPENLKVRIISSSVARLSWTAPKHEDLGCRLYNFRLSYENSSQNEVITVELNSTDLHYDLNDLQLDTEYKINLTIYTQFGESNHREMRFAMSKYVPGSNVDLSLEIVSVQAREILLKWSSPAGVPENVNFTIEAQVEATRACDSISNALYKQNSTLHLRNADEALVPKLYPYSTYKISVLGESSDGFNASGYIIVNTSEAAPLVKPPKVSTMEANTNSLSFKWDPVPCQHANGQLGYRYSLRLITFEPNRRRRKRAEQWIVRDKETYEHTVSFSNLSPYTTYEFSVRGFTAAGDGPNATITHRTLDDVSLPPSVELIEKKNTSLLLEIVKPNPLFGKILNYDLQINSAKIEPWAHRIISVPAVQTRHLVKGLLPYTDWLIKARAETQLGWSEWSIPITIATLEGLPEAPQIISTLTVSSSAVSIQWRPPVICNGILLSYRLEYFDDASYINEAFNETAEPIFIFETLNNYTTKVEHDGFAVGSAYMVKVSAQTVAGYGEQDNATFTMAVSKQSGRKIFRMSAPPPTPVIDEYNNQDSTTREISMDITLKAVGNDYEFNPTFYEVIVVNVDARLDELALNDSGLSDYFTALENNFPYWIAARFSANKLLPDNILKFVIGDRQTYHGYYNGPVLRNYTYSVTLRTFGSEYFSLLSPLASQPLDDGDTETFVGVCQIWSISCVWFIIIIVITVVLFWIIVAIICLCKRRRKHKRKLSISEGRLNNTLETAHPNNIWQKSETTGNVDTPLIVLPSSDSSIQSGYSKTFNKNCNFFGPIPVKDLSDYISQRNSHPKIDFHEEFKQSTRDKTKPWTVAKKPENLKKNRYGNILPYDMTRVRLDPFHGQPDTDYINASFIDGYEKPKVYIATQGPKENTFQDFWRMIWQENVAVIVMLTPLVESRKKKCDQYWPNHSRLHGSLLVTMTATEHLADIIIRRFELKTVEMAEIREVTHYHYLDWPDQSVPLCVTSVLNLRRKVREEVQKRVSRSPIVVHCSGGAGRTGTFIAIDAMLNQAYEEDRVHIFKYVGVMWGSRSNLIQNVEQYRFVYDAVLEALQSGDTRVLCSRLPVYYRDICRTSECEPSDLYEQFNILNRLERRSSCFSCPDALNDENSKKNRSKDIVPVEHSRVRLRSIYEPVFEEEEPKDECALNDPYINAVLCDGFKRKGQILVTHMPLDDTVQDFWRMVVLNRSSVIVMLNDCEFIDENTVPGQYWPNEGCVQYGPYQVEVVTFEEMGMVTIRTLRVVDTRKTNDFIPLRVMQLQFLDWNPDKTIPNSVTSMLALVSVADVLRYKYGGPITAHCQDGAARCGIFCAAHVLKEQMETGQVDIFQTIKRLRRHRPQFITSVEQYQFCYELAVAAMTASEMNKETKLVTLV